MADTRIISKKRGDRVTTGGNGYPGQDSGERSPAKWAFKIDRLTEKHPRGVKKSIRRATSALLCFRSSGRRVAGITVMPVPHDAWHIHMLMALEG